MAGVLLTGATLWVFSGSLAIGVVDVFYFLVCTCGRFARTFAYLDAEVLRVIPSFD